ncbi:MAG TPA: uracil-DNA glycosylase [Caulobacteraceae bacterium]|nr:uracil-DNA glycosylase [Caulobacteraceae bacterium]
MHDARALESLLAFWVEAGIDAALAEAPVDRTLTPAEAPAPIAAESAPPPPERKRPPPPLTSAPPVLQATEPDKLAEAIAIATQAAAAAQDTEALAAAVAAFEGCPLKGGARQSVFARGRPDAPVMAIGEGPGGEEDLQGLPFVGRAGQLLDRMFAAAGLSERVFITNTVFWRPPGNRTPTVDEQAVCEPFVRRAIELVRPRVLLLVGAASARFLLKRSEGVLALRGRWFDWRSPDGELEIPALPTLHPAFLLRQPAAKKKSWEDLLLLAERLDRPDRPD